MRGLGFSCATTVVLLGLSSAAFAQTAPAAPAGANLQAGGLRPPEAVEGDPSVRQPSQTEVQLDRADKEDSGRGLEFVFLNAEVGPQILGLHTLKDGGLVDGALASSTGTGMTYGAGLGVRILVFTAGARFRFANFSDWQIWTLNAEAGMHIPLGRIEPYATLSAGYASLGGYDAGKLGFTPEGARGLDVRGGVGVDFYLTNTFSVGANLTGDFLFLSRKASTPVLAGASAEQQSAAAVFAKDGSGIGAGGTLSAVLGLHF